MSDYDDRLMTYCHFPNCAKVIPYNENKSLNYCYKHRGGVERIDEDGHRA